jgi:hypothetical protein
MHMKAVLIPLVALVLGASLTSFAQTNSAIQSTPIWVPFTATIQQEGHTQGGAVAFSEKMTYAVRKDSSFATAVERKFPDGNTYEIRTVRNVRIGTQLRVDGATRSTVSLSLHGPVRMPNCKIAGSEHKVLLDYDVYKVVEKWTWGEYTHVREMWVAPKLNCFPLATTVRQPSEGDGPAAFTESVVESIAVGDPDPTLFQAPAGYVKRTMEEFENLIKLRFPEMPFQATVPFAN